MKISAKTLKAFNQGAWSTDNEQLRLLTGRPSHAEAAFLRKIRDRKHGIMNGKITQKDIVELNY